MRQLIASFICAALLAWMPGTAGETKRDYLVLIGASQEEAMRCRGYGLLVVDADLFSADAIEQLRRQNGCVYSYLNIGSIECFREGYEQMMPYILGPYENWPEERWIDPSKQPWREQVIRRAEALYAKGIDGLFLDNADVYVHYSADAVYQGLMEILRAIRRADKALIVNGGDVFITEAIEKNELRGLIDGVNQETVFTAIDFDKGAFGAQSGDTRDYYLAYLACCKAYGLNVYLLEYGDDPAIRQQIERYCRQQGYVYAVADSLQLNTP